MDALMGDLAAAGLPESAPLGGAGLPGPASLPRSHAAARPGCWWGAARPPRSARLQAAGGQPAAPRAAPGVVAACSPGQQGPAGPRGDVVDVAVERQPAAGQQP